VRLAALVLIACLGLASSAAAVSWQRPVGGPVLRPFAVSPDRYARGQHRGVDLGAPPGARVRAACGGRVRFAGRVPGGGRTVSVVCGPLAATYQHLGTIAVRRGAVVAPGAVVGSVARAGPIPAVAAHVHLGAREIATGRYVDPLTLLGAAPRASPPLGGRPRRPAPLGPAPRPALRRPTPLRPTAAPALRRPVVAPTALRRGFEPRGAPSAPVSPAVWLGLAAFGLGLPLGGLVRLRRHRRGAENAGVRARRWAAAHR
jgi:murein DD-endopeptidase MepM/ murein hydrolase activator NlpD